MSLRLLRPALAAWTLAFAACAPTGFVETTANVLDEMAAFRHARKANTREGWEDFIRRYPDSSKAAQARQWLQAMPDGGADRERLRAELARSEAERAERARVDRLLREAASRRQEEERLKASAEAGRLAKEKAEQEELARAQREVAVSTQAAALLAKLQARLEELDRREAALRVRETELAKPAAPAVSDDVDTPPPGAAPASDENFAVVIGIERYRDLDAGADFAERDARTILLYLRDSLGYPEQNIRLLTGDRASRSDFAKALELWLPLQVTAESKVFVYYSGHGAPDPRSREAYLLPYDGDPKALELTAYPLSRLYEKLNALPAKEVVVALDSCFSGAGGRSVIARGARPLVSRVDTGALDPRKALTVFTAAGGDEITGSYEPQRHGLFTYYFLRGLRGDADADADGWVTVGEQHAYLKKSVSRQANRDSREQTPQLQPDPALRRDKGAQRLIRVAR